jgi:hypothetical protein
MISIPEHHNQENHALESEFSITQNEHCTWYIWLTLTLTIKSGAKQIFYYTHSLFLSLLLDLGRGFDLYVDSLPLNDSSCDRSEIAIL